MTHRQGSWLAQVVCIAGMVLASVAAQAQSDWRTAAVPFYTSAQYAQAAMGDAFGRAQDWRVAAERLQRQLQAHCSAGTMSTADVRAGWRDAANTWDRLDAVEIGALVRRRSARSVDFMPARAAMLARAIETQPRDAAAMERIGAPAKGFEALEWLLWPDAPAPQSARCNYALAVAAHLARESGALADAFALDARVEPEPEQAEAAFAEAINQWVGGVERLRWAFMRKPLEVGETRGEPAVFPRSRSGNTAASWAARWQTLRSHAVLGERATPARTGADSLIPFETWLRSRGANTLADQLVQATGVADAAMAAATPAQPDRVRAAAAALADVTHLVQGDVAQMLNVSMGFSDADGD